MAAPALSGITLGVALLIWDAYYVSRPVVAQDRSPLVLEDTNLLLSADADFTLTYSNDRRSMTFSDNYPSETRVCYRTGCTTLGEIAQGAP